MDRDMDVLTQLVVLGLSLLVSGVGLYSAWAHFAAWRHHARAADFWLILMNVGMAGVVALIGQAVGQAEGIPLNWQTGAYIGCLMLIIIGLIGLARVQRRERRSNHEPAT